MRLTTPGLDIDQFRALRGVLLRHRGDCEVLLHVEIPNRSETVIKLPSNLRVAPTDEIIDDTTRLFGYNVVSFE